MKRIGVGFAVVFMLFFVFNSVEKAFCAAPDRQQEYDDRYDGRSDSIQPDDESAPDNDQRYDDRGTDNRSPDDQGYDDQDEDPQEPAPPPPADVRPRHSERDRPGALFDRIAVGMSMRHVTDLIGPPSDTKQYMTGKSFIPFYMGTDTVRLEAFYRGQGRIIFTGRPLRVYQIINNPKESGYNE